jgi:phosphate starvation-inducible PhoH-like protein
MPRRNRKSNNNNKFSEERTLAPIVPKTKNQERYIDFLKTHQVVIAEGSAGSGKTFIAAAHAADRIRHNKIDKIIVARPYVQTGRHSGSKPGTSLEKLYPYVRNILDVVQDRLGFNVFHNLLKDGLRGRIEVQEVESIRGRSFDLPSILIIEEAQQTTPEEMESIVTRIGEDCQLIITGDPLQKDIKGLSGLEWLSSFVERHNIEVGHVKFLPEDCVRSGFVGQVLRGLDKDRTK